MEQSLVGKVLSSCAMVPPMAGELSSRCTLKPGVGQVQRGLDAGDTGAHHQHRANDLVLRLRCLRIHISVSSICWHRADYCRNPCVNPWYRPCPRPARLLIFSLIALAAEPMEAGSS